MPCLTKTPQQKHWALMVLNCTRFQKIGLSNRRETVISSIMQNRLWLQLYDSSIASIDHPPARWLMRSEWKRNLSALTFMTVSEIAPLAVAECNNSLVLFMWWFPSWRKSSSFWLVILFQEHFLLMRRLQIFNHYYFIYCRSENRSRRHVCADNVQHLTDQSSWITMYRTVCTQQIKAHQSMSKNPDFQCKETFSNGNCWQ